MKKLLIATDCFLPRWDGIVRFLLEIIPKLKEEYEITILTPNFGEYEKISDVIVKQFSVFKINFGDIEFSGFNYLKIKKYVNDSDLVFVQTIGPIGTDAIKAAKRLKKPVIAYVHSIEWELTTRSLNKFKWLINKLTKWYARRHYNRCDLLIVPSIEVEEKHKKNGIITSKEIVHLGTDTEKFKPIINKKDAKLKLGFDPYQKIIGFSGRIGREKDLITLYRAFRRIEKKFPDVKLLIVGKGVKELEDIFSSSRNIIMPGSVNNVEDYYRAMDIFVLPSLTETSSLATMEAMSSGLPVCTTPVGFVKEYIQEKKNGMFFPFKNSLVLSMKLEMLLENDVLRETLGKEARKTIMSKFRWEHTIERISEILRKY
jgi:glycosyltransferase involved in cell wall biosynthesis